MKKLIDRIKNILVGQKWYNLSFVLSLWSCIMLLSVAVIGTLLMWMSTAFGWVDLPFPRIGLFITLIVCVVLGTAEAGMAYRSTIRSITQINEAMNEVAHGNLNVSLNEDKLITELSMMSVSFNKMVHELSASEMLSNDFTANVSHEFKTPLAAIDGYATLLQDDSLTEAERNEYLTKISETARQLSDMTDHILFLTRLEARKLPPSSVRFSLDEQIRRSVLELEDRWTAKGIELDIELDSVECVASQELMRHVWLNLIENAIKFTPDGGTLRLRLTQDGDTVTVIVADTGIGMTGEEQKHIFEKFYQSDRSRNSEGNGLGLPLVKRILDVCSGTVTVKSKPDCGSVFTVVLPKDAAKL